ncbi:hypothetical protein WME79_25480 [Sorangium sp. So ce726]|uniref:hypothetical protein n=1 Tax=Sorangium sp. So ce726 TaxID=3133319 RepID=UPI003F5FA664
MAAIGVAMMNRGIFAPGTVVQGRYEILSYIGESSRAAAYKGRPSDSGLPVVLDFAISSRLPEQAVRMRALTGLARTGPRLTRCPRSERRRPRFGRRRLR